MPPLDELSPEIPPPWSQCYSHERARTAFVHKGLSTILRMNTSRVVRFTDLPRGHLRPQCGSGVLLVAPLDPAVAVPQATTGNRSAQ